MAYVGNKGTHTLSALDGNNTNPNEEAVFLPAAYSINGQALHYVPSSAILPTAVNGINPDGGTNTSSFLQRYYALSLPACQSAAYTPQPGVPAGACGWTQSIQYNGDNQDNHFNALQVTVAKTFSKGLSFTSNYAWQRAFDWAMNFRTWDAAGGKGPQRHSSGAADCLLRRLGSCLSAETGVFVQVAGLGRRSCRRMADQSRC